MVDFVDDQARAEAVKKWLSQYAGAIIVGVILALSLMYGSQYWHKRQMIEKEQASLVFEQLLATSPQTELSTYQKLASQLIKQYPKTPYASFANLLLAKAYVQQADYQDALHALMWVSSNAPSQDIRQIAILRAARVEIALKDYPQALALLNKIHLSTFYVLADELRGDIAFLEQHYSDARQFYQKALQEEPDAQVQKPVLKAKLHMLPAN